MCFSAQADTLAGLAVTAIGIDALRQVHRPQERALGAVPVVLGMHLLVEAVVWRSLTGSVAESTGRLAMWGYLAVALLVVPVLVPLAIRAVEPDAGRRRTMGWLAVAGVCLALVYLVVMVRGPVDVRIDGRHLAYRLSGTRYGGLLAAAYAIVACAPPMLSSERRLAQFGLANLMAVVVLTWLQSRALTSLWCAWAAVSSIAIVAHLRWAHRGADVRTHLA